MQQIFQIMILDKIEQLLNEVQHLDAKNAADIETLRLKYLSKKGEINALMADFRNVPAEDKKAVGMKINELKQTAFDRINALKTEARKLGFVIHDKNDSELYWDGERCEPQEDAAIDTYEDHRMALAFAPAAFRLKSLRINNPQVVSKSYPKYWEDLKAAGYEVKS